MGFSPILNLICGGSAAKRLLWQSSSSSSAAAYANNVGSRSASSTMVGHTRDENSRSRRYHSGGLPSYMRAAVFREPNEPLSVRGIRHSSSQSRWTSSHQNQLTIGNISFYDYCCAEKFRLTRQIMTWLHICHVK